MSGTAGTSGVSGVVAVVVVPLLPDATYGPLDVLNPRQLGWLTLLIAGIVAVAGSTGSEIMRIVLR